MLFESDQEPAGKAGENPFHYAQFSCQNLYSTLSSAKAGEVLQLQITDMRYEEERRQIVSVTIFKQNASNDTKIQLGDKKDGFGTIFLTHHTESRNMKASRGIKC